MTTSINGTTENPATAHTLLIGYGNTLRGDDGIGPAVAEGVASLRLPGVRVLVVHQLTPEQAADIAEARLVVFVDATVGAESVTETRLDADAGVVETSLTHAVDPRSLLMLARAVYGRSPEAWLVTAAGEDFDFREGLSPTGQENARLARTRVESILRTRL